MFREEVAAHYRAKGYQLREQVKVRGQSGTVHALDMVAQSPLGNLLITFDDDLEGPELAAMRRTARDVGATAVVAAPTIPERVRPHAAREGVVLMDRAALAAPPPAEVPEFSGLPEPEPWPDQRPDRRLANASAAVLEDLEAVPEPVKAVPAAPVPDEPANDEPFAWLSKEAPAGRTLPRRPAGVEPSVLLPLRWILSAIVAGAVGGLVFYALYWYLG